MFTSLARIGTAESAAAVLPLLRSDDANLRTGALDALRAMIERDADRMLPALLADPDVDVRILSCELARGLPSAEANRLLCDAARPARPSRMSARPRSMFSRRSAGPRRCRRCARCAERFADDPFLAFAIKVATDRIRAQPLDP